MGKLFKVDREIKHMENRIIRITEEENQSKKI